MSDDSCLKVKNLRKDYGEKQALAGITLTLEKGEIMGLVGPNGAGKTTLIKLITGLIHPTSGSIRIFGRERDDLASHEWRAVGYIAEEPNLYDFMSVQEIINFNRGFYPHCLRKRMFIALLISLTWATAFYFLACIISTFYREPVMAGVMAGITGLLLSLPGIFAVSRNFSIFYNMRAADYFLGGESPLLTLGAGLLLSSILLFVGLAVFKKRDF